jgi:sirohydrochlorin ferrochelatase
MNALIFLAHGSRREKSNQEVFSLVDSMRPALVSKFDVVDAAFLEIVSPSLRDVVDQMLGQGAQSIVIYPFFLNSGSHVDRDIPAIVNEYRSRYPDCRFEVTRHFGASDEVPDMIVGQLSVGN